MFSSKHDVLAHCCAGLVNLGNTCFLNAVLQCLGGLPEVAAALLPSGGSSSSSSSKSVCWRPRAAIGPALCELLTAMRHAGGTTPSVLAPRRLLRALCDADDRWSDGEQQDAMEVLHCLLQLLQVCSACLQQPILVVAQHGSKLHGAVIGSPPPTSVIGSPCPTSGPARPPTPTHTPTCCFSGHSFTGRVQSCAAAATIPRTQRHRQ